jgi:hypothetical protein
MKLQTVEINEVDFASQGNAVLGIRDSGKTYTATWFAERLLDAQIPFVAFDPIGVWRYLRVGTSGNEGYKVVVAGDDADLPLTPETAPNIVRAAMKENIPLVIDLYSMSLSKHQWKQIVEQSVRLLLYENKSYGTRHIFIEEAAEFIPQRPGPDQGKVYAEIEKLARMGRNASLGFTLINQRAEEISKAVLELCDCLVLHRQKGRHSLTALDKWLSIADTENTKEVVKSLPTLPQGQCWIWQAGSTRPQLVTIPAKLTVHPDPKKTVPGLYNLSVDVSQFVSRLKHSLTQQQFSKLAEVSKKAQPADERRAPKIQVIDPEEYERMKEERDAVVKQRDQARAESQELRQKLEAVKKLLEPQYTQLQQIFQEVNVTAVTSNGSSPAWSVWLDKMTGKQRDMLQELIKHRRLTKRRLGFLIGMSAEGGGFNNYISKLVTLGLAKREGNEIVLQEM